MADAFVSELGIYPIKSLGQIALKTMQFDALGPVADRRLMVVDTQRRYLTQRQLPQMAQIGVAQHENSLLLSGPNGESFTIKIDVLSHEQNTVTVTVWDDIVQAVDCGDLAARWLSKILKRDCRLVSLTDQSQRLIASPYDKQGREVSFADGYPVLLISQTSLDDLNSKLEKPVTSLRFRPNIVVDGDLPFAEDKWRRIKIGDVAFDVAKLCSRCVVPSIDPRTGLVDKVVSRTLAGYRRASDGEVYFGQNLIPDLTYSAERKVRVGDPVKILR